MRADKETELIIRTTFCYDFLANVIQGLEELRPTIAWGREIGNPWIHKTRVSRKLWVVEEGASFNGGAGIFRL